MRLWDVEKKTQIGCSKDFDFGLRAIDWSPDGSFLAMGDSRGCVFILDSGLNVVDRKATKFTSMKTKKGGY